MIKNFIQRILRKLGFEIHRVPGRSAAPRPAVPRPPLSPALRHRNAVIREPLNAELHLEYALEASAAGKPYLALAELKTAAWLGAPAARVDEHLPGFLQAIPDALSMNHNQYFRFSCLAAEVRRRAAAPEVAVLDVGGGEGQLASFLPGASYCLAEPRVNGISGTSLPFADASFDYVVSCHVLEHIPVPEREAFLDQLLAKARRGVILLNPFQVEGTRVNERLGLILAITGADWAREHLECTLPRVEDIAQYAARRDIPIEISPNGTMTTSMAFVFLDYFARLAAQDEDWKKVNRFFNENYIDLLHSETYPNAYLIYLGRPGSA